MWFWPLPTNSLLGLFSKYSYWQHRSGIFSDSYLLCLWPYCEADFNTVYYYNLILCSIVYIDHSIWAGLSSRRAVLPMFHKEYTQHRKDEEEDWVSTVRGDHLELTQNQNLKQKGHYEIWRKTKRKPESLKRAKSGKKEVGGNRNTRISNIGKKHSETWQGAWTFFERLHVSFVLLNIIFTSQLLD